MAKEIIWNAPEFEHREKTLSWYWLTIIGAALLVGLAVWQKNVLFGVFVVIAEILVLVWAGREPRAIPFRINEKQFFIGPTTVYTLDQFQAFSLDSASEEELVDLVLHFKSKVRPLLKIKLPKATTSSVHEFLAARLEERAFEASLLDAVEKLLKF